MKTLITLLAILTTLNFAFSQKSNLIFYTENGERFQIVLNGILQNATSETNVKVTDLVAPNYQVKVLFENKTFGEISKNIFFNQGNETTYTIKHNNKGEYVFRFRSEVPMAQAPPTPVGQTAIIYTTVPATTTTVSTTETTTVGGTNSGVSMGVNVGGNNMGLNVNLNINDGMGNAATTTSTSYSQTTTTTSTNISQPVENVVVAQPATVIYVPGYSGNIGCPAPVNPNEFESIKRTISSKSFEDSKLTIAKQVVSAKCLTCGQVKEIMLLFSFEDSRLEFAKFAYKHTYDIENYYILNDAFTFEASIDELNDYINGGY